MPGGSLLQAVRTYVRGIDRADNDFVNVVIPEVVGEGLFAYLVRRRSLIRLKSGLLRESRTSSSPTCPVHVAADSRSAWMVGP